MSHISFQLPICVKFSDLWKMLAKCVTFFVITGKYTRVNGWVHFYFNSGRSLLEKMLESLPSHTPGKLVHSLFTECTLSDVMGHSAIVWYVTYIWLEYRSQVLNMTHVRFKLYRDRQAAQRFNDNSIPTTQVGMMGIQ